MPSLAEIDYNVCFKEIRCLVLAALLGRMRAGFLGWKEAGKVPVNL